MLLIIINSLILSNSVRLPHAHPMQVGMQLLPACCVFGGGGKEHEVDVGKNGQKNWFGLVWFSLVLGEVLFGFFQHCVYVLKK